MGGPVRSWWRPGLWCELCASTRLSASPELSDDRSRVTETQRGILGYLRVCETRHGQRAVLGLGNKTAWDSALARHASEYVEVWIRRLLLLAASSQRASWSSRGMYSRASPASRRWTIDDDKNLENSILLRSDYHSGVYATPTARPALTTLRRSQSQSFYIISIFALLSRFKKSSSPKQIAS